MLDRPNLREKATKKCQPRGLEATKACILHYDICTVLHRRHTTRSFQHQRVSHSNSVLTAAKQGLYALVIRLLVTCVSVYK